MGIALRPENVAATIDELSDYGAYSQISRRPATGLELVSKGERSTTVGSCNHRRQHALLSRLAVETCPPVDKPALERMHELLTSTGPSSRLALAAMAGQLRRRPRDRGIIGILIALGVW